MGADAGFDLVPPLGNTPADNDEWAAFLAAVRHHYEHEHENEHSADDRGHGNGNGHAHSHAHSNSHGHAHIHAMTLQPHGIVFQVGEHPTLPYKGYLFRRFSSKITGAHGYPARAYIHKVTAIARRHFGRRVVVWDEVCDVCGHYGWREVREMEKIAREGAAL